MIKQYLKKIPILPGIYRKIRELLKQWKEKVIAWWNLIVIDFHNIDDTILLIGTGRSGTTWISNLLNHANKYRYIFEPFKETEQGMVHFGSEPYIITPEMDEITLTNAMRKILSGKSKTNDWNNKFNKKKISNKRIIKSIRLHFILKWVIEKFPNIKVVYLMRHPIPSSLSKAGLEWHWKTGSDYFENSVLCEKYLQPFTEVSELVTTPFLDNVLGWCVQNYVAFEELAGKSFLLVYYEDFCINPELATREMADFAGVPFAKEKLLSSIQEKYLITKQSAIINNEHLVLNWIGKVSEDEIASAMKIVKAFGLDEYYNENPYPLKSHLIDKD